MCGIAGLVGLNGQPVEMSIIKAMTRAVAHRGPDGEDVMVENNVGLGHRRLAIIDLTEEGSQPMTSANGRFTVVFNGEIYNYLELRTELQSLGHIFSTRTDTEVLLAAYAQWGVKCVRRFNGMWAFTVYDRMSKLLFCSRDRFGEKPFYYLHNENHFAFGSEIRQLLLLLSVRRANAQAVLKFIVANLAEGLDQSFFEGIRKLPGGHNLTLNLCSKEICIERYYELTVDHSLAGIDSEEAVQRFSYALEDAVRLRLRADVPVGTCLSGGLDSSSVATIASSIRGHDYALPIAAITACSEQADNDESHYAEQIVAHNHLTWHRIRPSYSHFSAALPAIVEAQEEPFPSPSIAMQYFVMGCARDRGIPVLLDGQGGDETLLGYERYFAAHYRAEAKKHGWLHALKAMATSSSNNAMMSAHRVLGYFLYFNSFQLRWKYYQHRHSYLRVLPEIFEEVRLYADACGDINALQKLEIERTNLPALLRYEDKNSMRHSVETRLPFLDYRLVELSISMPGSTKISKGWTKYLLRRAMHGKMPDSIVWRRNKLGFEAPERLWFKQHQEKMREAVGSSVLLASICRYDQLIGQFDGLDSLTQWRLYSVACWEQAFEVCS